MRIIGNRGNTARKVQAVASGALASGDTVIVNADGTVSVVADFLPTVFSESSTGISAATFDSSSNKVVIAYQDAGNSNYGTAVVGTVSGTSITFGSPVVFGSTNATMYPQGITFDSNSNKIVVAYRDFTNSQYGTAIVGTVSGTTISFGSPVVFRSGGTSWISATFDSGNNKIVISYQDNGNSSYGTAIVGTVSGTSISFGSATIYESGTANYTVATFDSDSGKVVIPYSDGTNGGYGTAVVGTVSGTSISFGTPVVFESAASAWLGSTFDSTANKVVIAYYDQGNSSFGTAIVGTVSGTTISFGSPVVFESSSTNTLSPIFNSNTGKVVIAYRDSGTSNYGTAVVGTVSGTSISFDTPIVYQNSSTSFQSTAFDSNSNEVVIAYQDTSNSSYGTALVFQNITPNLTSENFIGIASNGYATGQAATINAKGFIDDNQSSLTAGQSYYVQTNGDLGLTAADPSVFAGTAVSATKLIVKG